MCTRLRYERTIRKEAIGSAGVGAREGPSMRSCCTRIGKNHAWVLLKLVYWTHMISTNSWNPTKNDNTHRFKINKSLRTKNKKGNYSKHIILKWKNRGACINKLNRVEKAKLLAASGSNCTAESQEITGFLSQWRQMWNWEQKEGLKAGVRSNKVLIDLCASTHTAPSTCR